MVTAQSPTSPFCSFSSPVPHRLFTSSMHVGSPTTSGSPSGQIGPPQRRHLRPEDDKLGRIHAAAATPSPGREWAGSHSRRGHDALPHADDPAVRRDTFYPADDPRRVRDVGSSVPRGRSACYSRRGYDVDHSSAETASYPTRTDDADRRVG